MINLRALGTAEIRTPVVTLTPSQSIIFAAALYLIIERDKQISRSGLSSLLWPKVPSADRAHRFRQTLHHLRKLGVPLLANRDRVALADPNTISDLDTI